MHTSHRNDNAILSRRKRVTIRTLFLLWFIFMHNCTLHFLDRFLIISVPTVVVSIFSVNKFQIFWGVQKNLKKYPTLFWHFQVSSKKGWRFFQVLWPYHSIWTLIHLYYYLLLEIKPCRLGSRIRDMEL